jgi:hypothetical protein
MAHCIRPSNPNIEYRNAYCFQGVCRKQIRMTKAQNSKLHAVEDRMVALATGQRAKNVLSIRAFGFLICLRHTP